MTLPSHSLDLAHRRTWPARLVRHRVDDDPTKQHGIGAWDGAWNVCDRAAIGKSGQRIDGDHWSLDLMQPHGRKMAGCNHGVRLKYLLGDSACV